MFFLKIFAWVWFFILFNQRQIAKQLGETTSDKDLKEMIDRVDTHGQGYVVFSDFLTIMTKKRTEED